MTVVTKTIWKCDRCGHEIEESAKMQPTGWAGFSIHKPPKSSEEEKRWHLCKDCTRALFQWITTPPGLNHEAGSLG